MVRLGRNAHHGEAILHILVLSAAPRTARSRGCAGSFCVGAAGGGPDLRNIFLLRWRGRVLEVVGACAGGLNHESLKVFSLFVIRSGGEIRFR